MKMCMYIFAVSRLKNTVAIVLVNADFILMNPRIPDQSPLGKC